VKSYYELNNDPTKTCFEYKIKIKVDHKMKNLQIVQNGNFITYIVIFMEHFFVMSFLCFGICTYFIPTHYGLHSFKVLHQMMFISLYVHYVKRNN
jgi:hypothetical protein